MPNQFMPTNTGIGAIPPEFALQQQQLNRQQQMAQLLLQQGAQPQAAGQMVSGRYVPNSFFQNLQPVANMLVGAYMAKKGDEKALELAQQLRNQQQKMGEQYFEALQGKPAQPAPTGYELIDAGTPATGPDYRKAFSIATDPYAPKWLQAQAAEMLKEQKVGPEETVYRFNFATGQREPVIQGMPKVSQDIKDFARQAKLDVRNIDNWSEQDWQKVRNIEARVNQQKQTVVNIPNFAEKTFAGELAGNQAKRFDTLQSTAEKAPDTLRAVQQNRAILQSGKFFSGSPANVQLELAKMADAFGLGGTDTKTKAANSQTLITNAASATLDSISGSGLGAGQGFTDKDLKFLQDAKSFRITMTDENIRRILDLQERAARQSVMRYNDRLKTLPQSSVQTMGLRPIELPATNVRDQADAILNQSNQNR